MFRGRGIAALLTVQPETGRWGVGLLFLNAGVWAHLWCRVVDGSSRMYEVGCGAA